ncbi:hypothetical protein ACFLS9_04100 [Bacteroidota bacterium]
MIEIFKEKVFVMIDHKKFGYINNLERKIFHSNSDNVNMKFKDHIFSSITSETYKRTLSMVLSSGNPNIENPIYESLPGFPVDVNEMDTVLKTLTRFVERMRRTFKIKI